MEKMSVEQFCSSFFKDNPNIYSTVHMALKVNDSGFVDENGKHTMEFSLSSDLFSTVSTAEETPQE